MDRVLRHSWFRSSGSLRIALPLLIVLLGRGGYFLTSQDHQQRSRRGGGAPRPGRDACRRRECSGAPERTSPAWATCWRVSRGRSRRVRETGRRYGGQRGPRRRPVGAERAACGAKALRAAPWRAHHAVDSIRAVRARSSGSFVPARHIHEQNPPGAAPRRGCLGLLRSGCRSRRQGDRVRRQREQARALGGEPGFYLLEAAGLRAGPRQPRFPGGVCATGAGSRRHCRGTRAHLAINQDGRRIEGEIESADAAASFQTLGRSWRIDVAKEPPSGLQSTLPWLALAWPVAVALIVFLVGRTIMSRRRAEARGRADLRSFARPPRQHRLRRLLQTGQPRLRAHARILEPGAPIAAVLGLRPPGRPEGERRSVCRSR